MHMTRVLVTSAIMLAGSGAEVLVQNAPQSVDSVPVYAGKAEAYHLFMQALRLEDGEDIAAAIQALREAARLDPDAAGIPAALAALHARQNRTDDAISAAETALRLDAENVEAHRVLGLVFAALARQQPQRDQGERATDSDRYAERAVEHLEHVQRDQPFDTMAAFTLGRLHVETGAFSEAAASLERFNEQRPGFAEALRLLARAYVGLNRRADAVATLERAVRLQPQSYRTLMALAEVYEQDHSWQQAAAMYQRAVERRPRNLDMKRRWAAALLNAGERAQARDILREVVAARPDDGGALYLLSEVERHLANFDAAETAARRLMALDAEAFRGAYALGQVFLQRRQYRELISTLEPIIERAGSRERPPREISMLLAQTGFSHQALENHDAAISAFEQARAASPEDATMDAYLAEAYLEASRAGEALEFVVGARSKHPRDLRLAGLEATALAAVGQTDRGIAVMRAAVAEDDDNPIAHVALANLFVSAGRIDEAVQALTLADAKFPTETTILFQLGAILEQQKQYADAERVFRTVLSRDPLHHQALNYLGYMLAEQGDGLEESVELISRALESDPHNGAYLDSLGWAYFKLHKLGLAETYLRQASEQLTQNSVVQDHFGDLLFMQRRYAEAIDVWRRALAGDAESIESAVIEEKIRDAQEKLDR